MGFFCLIDTTLPPNRSSAGAVLTKFSWRRYQMETFSTLLALCVGNSPVTGEFPAQRLVTWNFDVFFDLCLNKRFCKQSRRWWFETPLHSLWRHCNVGRRIWWDWCQGRYPRYGWVITLHRMLWDVITYPCPGILLLATKSPYVWCREVPEVAWQMLASRS